MKWGDDMKRLMINLLVLIAALLFPGNTASAQSPTGSLQRLSSGNPYATGGRSPFSPYLNLLRRGNSTAFNYYGLVRPELEFRGADSQFRQQFSRVDRRFDRVAQQRAMGSNLTSSGHRVTFMSDLRGGPGSVRQGIQGRASQLANLPENSGSRLAPTGHAAWFGNTGTWFPARTR
jgi:hypothetical protein